jgi:hypothetical protein
MAQDRRLRGARYPEHPVFSRFSDVVDAVLYLQNATFVTGRKRPSGWRDPCWPGGEERGQSTNLDKLVQFNRLRDRQGSSEQVFGRIPGRLSTIVD